MNKEEFITIYGIEAYQKRLQQTRDWKKEHRERARANSRGWNRDHPDETKANSREWKRTHPEEVKATEHERNRKGGRYYEHNMQHQMNGMPHERALIRMKHGRIYRPYKQIIVPDSQIHHEWIPETADYRGVALVEKDQHIHGFIDIIRILEGEITLLTEEEVRGAL